MLTCETIATAFGILKDFSVVAGFSFEAGGRMFRPVVCHSTSGTLRSILVIFFTTVLYIFYLLRHCMNILTRG